MESTRRCKTAALADPVKTFPHEFPTSTQDPCTKCWHGANTSEREAPRVCPETSSKHGLGGSSLSLPGLRALW
eukprot:8770432-Alexandrium_andersonii.AAC.1